TTRHALSLHDALPIYQAEFDSDDGHLHLTRIHTSGNLVPVLSVEGRSIKKTSFYYIEPGIEQTITYLCLITRPRELLQVFAMFRSEEHTSELQSRSDL